MPDIRRFLCLLMLLSALAGCGGKTATPDAPPQALTVFDATGLTARPGETPEEIILRAHEYDYTAAALAAAGFGWGTGGFPKNSDLAFAYWSMTASMYTVTLGNYVSVMTSAALLEKPWDRTPEGLGFKGCKIGDNNPLARRFTQAGVFDIRRWCAGIPEALPGDPRWSDNDWGLVQAEEQVIAVAAKTLQRLRDTSPEKLVDGRAGDIPIPDARLQAFLAASSHDPEYERPVVSREKLLALARIHAHETNCAIRDGAVRYLNDTAPEAREAALIRIRAALGGDPEAMRAMADRYESEDASIPRTREAARVWREEADKAAAKANAAP